MTAERAMDQKVYYIREDKSLFDALSIFLRTQNRLLIVVNQSKTTVGVVILKDVVKLWSVVTTTKTSKIKYYGFICQSMLQSHFRGWRSAEQPQFTTTVISFYKLGADRTTGPEGF